MDRRTGDGEEPVGPDGGPADRFERVQRVAPAVGRGPSGPVVAIVGILAIALAIAKPWTTPEPSPAPPGDPGATAVAPGSSTVAASGRGPTDAPVIAAEAAASGMCFGIAEWRVVAAETWADHPVRTWSAADGQLAGDMLDPQIAFTPVIGRSVHALGFCAPVAGEDRPPDDASVALWRIDGRQAVGLRPAIREPRSQTPFGRRWWPPAGPPDVSGGWPSGRYVVGIAGGDYIRWLGIQVVLIP